MEAVTIVCCYQCADQPCDESCSCHERQKVVTGLDLVDQLRAIIDSNGEDFARVVTVELLEQVASKIDDLDGECMQFEHDLQRARTELSDCQSALTIVQEERDLLRVEVEEVRASREAQEIEEEYRAEARRESRMFPFPHFIPPAEAF